MWGSCLICSQVLMQRMVDSDICATDCGHLFHKLCLEKRLSTLLECPECGRFLNPMTDVTKIFLDEEDSFFEEEDVEELNKHITQLENQKSLLEVNLHEAKAELKISGDRRAEHQKENELLKAKVRVEDEDNKISLAKMADLEKMRATLVQNGQKIKETKAKLKDYEGIKNLVCESSVEIEMFTKAGQKSNKGFEVCGTLKRAINKSNLEKRQLESRKKMATAQVKNLKREIQQLESAVTPLNNN